MAGFFGKLPNKGDFLTRNLSRPFVDPWDDWLQGCMNTSKEALGEGWLQVYLTSPLWRFTLPPGVCGERAWAGVMMPSMDRVGRYFPMTVVTELETASLPILVAARCNAWFEAVEDCLLEALEDDAMDVDVLAEQLQSFEFDQGAARLADKVPGSLEGNMDLDQGMRTPLADDLSVANAFMDLTAGFLHESFQDCSIWWGRGSDRITPSLVYCRGLPAAERFPAMLDGQWTVHGWSDSALLPYQANGSIADLVTG